MKKKDLSMEKWDLVIRPKAKWLDLDLKAIIKSKDLLWMFVWRDFVAQYKQTILGPLWFFIQPLLTTIVFTIIFGKIAKIPTDGIPQTLFYMSGIIGWNYFSDCLNSTSNTFSGNAAIFGKVYFPRLIVPISVVISNLSKFLIQLLLFLVFYFYYKFKGADIQPNAYLLIIPLLLAIMAGLGFGAGVIISSLTTKYRDLRYLIGFGTQLLMYVTPIVYPLSFIPEKHKWFFLINPMSPVVETFRYAFLGTGSFNWFNIGYSGVCMIVILTIGMLIFNKVEKNFMDTV